MRQESLLHHASSRLLGLVPTLLLLVTISFFLIRVAPGGPFDAEMAAPPEIRAKLEAKYHLDEPLLQQYFRYLGEIIAGDFGPSFQYKDWSVNELIARGFPISATIGGLAMLLAFFAGTLIGIFAALRQNRLADHALMGIGMLGISIPNFVIAPLLILGVAVYAGWLPAGGWDWSWQRMVLPVLTLALPVIAYIARLMRGSMIEVLHSNFIRTARAKGLPERIVIRRHALKPAILPVISYMGPATAAMITGSVVVERIYSIPGLGSYTVDAINNQDFAIVRAMVFLGAVLYIVGLLLTDISYTIADPRVRLE